MSRTPRRSKTGKETGEAEMPRELSGLQGWRPARQVADAVTARLPSRRVTINLDEDIIAIFKAQALRGGAPYQVAINQALRAYLNDRQTSEQDRAVETVLTALDDEKVIRKLHAVRRLRTPLAHDATRGGR